MAKTRTTNREKVEMATLQATPRVGVKAPGFTLPATDGKTYSLADVAGPKGTVVAFICNHCPYVRAVVDRMVADANTLAKEGIGFVAISCNDPVAYPEDSFDNMKLFAQKHAFPFPYLFDESQAVARAYNAACTPEFYGLNAAGTIEYNGRLDEGRKEAPPPDARRELLEAMRTIARTGKGPKEQMPSMGCSIKWKRAA
jgi:peroxiredoxin